MMTIVDVDGDIVLMDTAADAYLCIGREHAVDNGTADGQATGEFSAYPVAESLAAAGLSPAQWKWADPALARERHDVIHVERVDAFRIMTAVPRMIVAGIITLIRLRGPVAHYHSRSPGRMPADRAQVGALVAIFDALRPFIPKLGRCLPHSLYLRDFLGLHGIAATLVFGVRTHPFEAHCWVEHDGCVLNDTADHVAWFTPIYAC